MSKKISHTSLWVVATLLLYALVMWQTWFWVNENAVSKQSRDGYSQLQLYVTHLQGELAKYEFLPELIATNKRMVELLLSPADPERVDALNRYLETINTIARASDTYLMNRDGLTIAASNWQTDKPFIGRNFSYRPYFKKAMNGELGRYFALGTTSKRRGYYFAYPVRYQGEILGAVVLKMDITNIEEKWRERQEEVLVTDPDGVVFITTKPQWRFHMLETVEDDVITRINESKRYPEIKLPQAPLFKQVLTLNDQMTKVSIERDHYFHLSVDMADAGWKVHLLKPVRSINSNLLEIQGLATLLFLALVLLLLYIRQRQKRLEERHRFEAAAKEQLEKSKAQLEQRVYQRTEALIHEIEERKSTEEELRHTQDELIQAAKLAVIGELSTGITHEINQPLAAIRSYADNARLLLQNQRTDEVESNLHQIAELTNRMAQISSQLKLFARKTDGENRCVSLHTVIDNACSILQPQFKKSHTELILNLPEQVMLIANPVQLEQVLVNLFGNAMNAMVGVEKPVIMVSMQTNGAIAHITIHDSGPGIDPENLSRIFDPFFTTREKGLGLGLSISQRIMKGMGGDLNASNHENGGAMFILKVPHAKAQ